MTKFINRLDMSMSKDLYLIRLLQRELGSILDLIEDWEYRLQRSQDTLSEEEIMFVNQKISDYSTQVQYLQEQIEELKNVK